MRLRSFKLRLRDTHVRVVPATDETGCAFSGPGVDLLGDDARRALEASSPLVAMVESMEPGVRVRSIAIDLEARKLLATLDPTTPEADPRPRVIRLPDGPLLDRALDAAPDLMGVLVSLATAALARRAKTE